MEKRNFIKFKKGHWYIYTGDPSMNIPIRCNEICSFSGNPVFNVFAASLLEFNWKDNFIEVEPPGTKVIKGDMLYSMENRIYFPVVEMMKGSKINTNFIILKRSETETKVTETFHHMPKEDGPFYFIDRTYEPTLRNATAGNKKNIFTKPKKEKIILGIKKRTKFNNHYEKYEKYIKFKK